MIWSNNDVANDFTELEGDFPSYFIKAGIGVYREFQRKLWDPQCAIGAVGAVSP